MSQSNEAELLTAFHSEAEKLGGLDAPEAEATTEAQSEDKPKTETQEEAKDPTAEKRAQLEALAKEMDLVIDGNRLTEREKLNWKSERRRKEGKLRAEYESKFSELAEERKVLQAFRSAHEAGDLDAIAKILGHDSWTGINETMLRKISSPEAKALAALKQEVEKERQAREKLEQERQAELHRQQLTQAEQEFYGALQEELSAETAPPVIRQLLKFPTFLPSVRDEMRSHWDGEDTISPIEAAQRVAKRAQDYHAQMSKVFGSISESRSNDTTNGASSVDSRARASSAKSKNIAQTHAADASPARPTEYSDSDWLKMAVKELEKAQRAD